MGGRSDPPRGGSALPWKKWLFAAGLFALILLAACGGKKAGLQDQAVLPDKTLHENGLEFLTKSQFIKSRLSFQTLINTYDESPYLEKAKYYIAYSYLREGGIENIIQAEQAFKDFKLFFPTSDLADDAQAHVVKINMRLMKEPNRDISYALRSKVEVLNFLNEFPDSPLVPEMQARLQYIEDTLAMSNFLKAKFYHRKNFAKASSARLRECVIQYPHFRFRDEALFLLADSLDKLKNFDESTIYYAQLARGYPFSKYFEEARDRLRKLEKPVPEVDQRLAEENKKYWEEGKSFLGGSREAVFGSFGLGKNEPWRQMEKQRDKEERERLKIEAGKAEKSTPKTSG